MSKVSNKHRITLDTNSRNMRILADKVCRFTNISNIRHNDDIAIPYRKYDFRLSIKIHVYTDFQLTILSIV